MLLRAVCEVDSELTVEVFSGSRAKSLPLLRQLAIELPNKITIRTDVSDMARLISRQDVIVTASGSIVWELCCLGMPSLLVVTAYNQSSNAKLLVNQGAANVVGSFLENEIAELAGKLAENLRVFKHSREVVEAISIRAAQLCDGLGADRVAQIMITRSKSQYG